MWVIVIDVGLLKLTGTVKSVGAFPGHFDKLISETLDHFSSCIWTLSEDLPLKEGLFRVILYGIYRVFMSLYCGNKLLVGWRSSSRLKFPEVLQRRAAVEVRSHDGKVMVKVNQTLPILKFVQSIRGKIGVETISWQRFNCIHHRNLSPHCFNTAVIIARGQIEQ